MSDMPVTNVSPPKMMNPPLPKATTIENYTHARIREAQLFAAIRIRRQSPLVSPRATRTLWEYERAISRTLCASSPRGARQKRLAKLQELEEELNRAPFLVGDWTEYGVAEHGRELLQIREAIYRARYRDIIADIARRDVSISIARDPGHGLRTTEMWAKLNREHVKPPRSCVDAELDLWFKGLYGREIECACAHLGISRAVILKAAEMYAADRKEGQAVGSDLDVHLLVGNFGTLAKALHNDLEELPNVFPPSRQAEMEIVKEAVERYWDRYYDIHGNNCPEDPSLWEATAEAYAARKRAIKEVQLREEEERRREAVELKEPDEKILSEKEERQQREAAERKELNEKLLSEEEDERRREAAELKAQDEKIARREKVKRRQIRSIRKAMKQHDPSKREEESRQQPPEAHDLKKKGEKEKQEVPKETTWDEIDLSGKEAADEVEMDWVMVLPCSR